MKKHLLPTLIFIIFSTCSLMGQLKIDSLGYSGIGGNPSTFSQAQITKSIGLRYGLSINPEFNAFDNNNSGIYINANTTGANVPIHGIYNYTSNAGGNFGIGIYNQILATGTGSKIGIRHKLSDDVQGAASSTNWMTGANLILTHAHYPIAWGLSIDVNSTNTSSSDKVYGQEIKVRGGGAAETVGLQVSVDQSGDPNAYAAKFIGGDVSITGGSFVQTSDQTLKQNIVGITEALSIIDRLAPKAYEFRGDTRFNFNPEERQYGFLAQELEEVLPTLVKDVPYSAVYRPGYFKGIPGPDGEEISEEEAILYPATTYKAVKYIDLIPIIVQAMKEQQVEIDLLNNALENPFGRSVSGGSQITNKIQTLAQENVQLKADLAALSSAVNDLKSELADLKDCTDCYGSREIVEMGVIESLVSIYPNPASSQVTINTKLEGEYEVKVLTIDGRLLMTNKYLSRVVTINTSAWASGTYLFEIVTQKGEVADRVQVVIQK